MRVFNVSLHKSATMSMWQAFSSLGFSSIHFPHRFFDAYRKGELDQCAELREDNKAYSDLPITFMYRKLFRLFPDARFILVVRPFEQWIESLRTHLDRIAYDNRDTELHAHFYGYPITSRDFDEQVCWNTYRRHHEDVQAFFSKRGNFLSLKLADLTWEPLCSFLNRPVPDEPFPRINVSAV